MLVVVVILTSAGARHQEQARRDEQGVLLLDVGAEVVPQRHAAAEPRVGTVLHGPIPAGAALRLLLLVRRLSVVFLSSSWRPQLP